MIGGCSFEAKNQRCFYIDFTRLHLSFQLCVASVNLPNPSLCYCCVHLEIEALNENICRWETTWFTFIYCIFKCFNLVGYDLYQGVTHNLVHFMVSELSSLFVLSLLPSNFQTSVSFFFV